MGGAPLASIAMGRGDNAKAERILGSACVFLLVMSLVLTVLCFWAMRPMLLMFGASEQTIGYAVDYFFALPARYPGCTALAGPELLYFLPRLCQDEHDDRPHRGDPQHYP